jgi:hypothetical protein
METYIERPTFPSLKQADTAHNILQKIVAGAYLDLETNEICIDGWIPITDTELNYIRQIAAEQA